MKDYTETSPGFNSTIQIPETTDTNHADNINHAPIQIYENTIALKNQLETGIAEAEDYAALQAAGALTDAKEYTDTSKSTAVSATLTASGWSSDDPPTQKVTVAGLTASTNGFISLAQGIDSDVYAAGAKAQLAVQSQTEDELEVAAFGDVPEVDIPISVVTLW